MNYLKAKCSLHTLLLLKLFKFTNFPCASVMLVYANKFVVNNIHYLQLGSKFHCFPTAASNK